MFHSLIDDNLEFDNNPTWGYQKIKELAKTDFNYEVIVESEWNT